ncbi:TPA: hypothetical protein UL931_000839 [Stenotrophomonas maltophilia]|nr:hypothetical protein [Stenotrophomonas maltophilia]
MDRNVRDACDNYLRYRNEILVPLSRDVYAQVESVEIKLYQAFSANYFLAHAVDYIHAIRSSNGVGETRGALIKGFDRKFDVGGGRLSSIKFQLIDGVNNALKHIELESKRYEALEGLFGPISFRCLVEHNGKVLCFLDGYRFDHVKVVLLPALKALASPMLNDRDDVLRFAMSEGSISPVIAGDLQVEEDEQEWFGFDDDDPSTAIDRMIDYVNPCCVNCSESADECECATYMFEGKVAKFEPFFDKNFNFNHVMSQISPGFSRS